jgi:hypothetical protein
MKIEVLKPGIPKGRKPGTSRMADAYAQALDLLPGKQGVTITLDEVGLNSSAYIYQIVSRYNRYYSGNIGVRKISDTEYQLHKRA